MAKIYRIDEFRVETGVGSKPPCPCDAVQIGRDLLAREVMETRRTIGQPFILRLENLDHGVPTSAQGWDLIYSIELLSSLSLPAARQLLKTATQRLKPGGRLLFGNVSPQAGLLSCRESPGQNFRSEIEMAKLTQQIPEATIAGQTVFRDETGLNVFLEVYKTPLLQRAQRR